MSRGAGLLLYLALISACTSAYLQAAMGQWRASCCVLLSAQVGPKGVGPGRQPVNGGTAQ